MDRPGPGLRSNRFAARRNHRRHWHRVVQPARTGHGPGESMNARAKKILLLLLAAALLFGSSRMQQSLNRDRDQLGLVRASALQNAPPMLAFTTVALGGFRGLISNYALDSRQRFATGRQVFRGGATGGLDHGPGAAFLPGLAVSGVEHGLQHFHQVQGFSRPLALGRARHRTAARRRSALQPG